MSLIRSDSSVPLPALLKRFALIYLPVVLVLSLILLSGIRIDGQRRMERAEVREKAQIKVAKGLMLRDLAAVATDLRVFANLPLLRWYQDSGNPVQREELEKLFLVLARESRRYDQVRYLDASGQEVIRINYNAGKPVIVPHEQMQNKAGRYYFDDTFKLNDNQIFVSPLDLNIEHGSLEIPHKPMIRFGTPVFDSAGRKKGIILLNYFGSNLLQHFREAMNEPVGFADISILLNRDGYWLSAAKTEDEWGFMLGKKERTFGHDFPDEWRAISAAEQGSLLTDQGLFVYTTVYPLLGELVGEQHTSAGSPLANAPSQQNLTEHDYHWKIVSFVPHDVLTGAAFYNQPSGRIAIGAIYLLLALAAWIVASVTLSRKRAENDLLEAKCELQEFFDLVPDMVCIASAADGCFRQVNKIWETTLGFTTDELIGKPFIDFIHPDDVAATLAEVEKQLASQPTRNFMNRYRCKDGSYKWLEWVATPASKNKLLYAAARDITERKEQEELLRKSAATIEDLYNNAPCGYHSLDNDGIIRQINNTELAWLGYTRDEVVGKMKYTDFLTPASTVAFREKFPLVKKQGFIHDFQYEIIRKDGTKFSCLANVTAICDANGDYLSSRSTVFDFTERKQTEEALKSVHEELLKKNGRLEEFHQVVVDREMRMVEMKDEMNGLLERLGEPRKYVEVDSLKKR